MKTVNTSLKNTLFANATFSAVSAMSILMFPSGMAEQMGITNIFWLTFVAIGLLLFVGLVVFVARFKTHQSFWVNLIIVQDLIWVMGSALVLLFQPWGLSNTGLTLITLVAILVGFFAWRQNHYLRTGFVKN